MSKRDSDKSLPRRYTKFNAVAQRRFLKQLELTGNLEASARAVDITPQAVYGHMKRYPAFKDAVEKARQAVVHDAEVEMRRRAIEGVDTGIYYKGELIATEKRYSDPLLVEILKANAPEKYGRKDATINVNHNVMVEDKTKSKLASLLGIDIDIIEGDFKEVEQINPPAP